MFRQATLIQDIREFFAIIQPPLLEIFEQDNVCFSGASIEDTVEWIIAQQIENCYGLSVQGHTRERSVYSALHDQVANALPYPISLPVRQLIKVPLIYDDQSVSIDLRGTDLYVFYYIDTALLFTRP
ncbi:hypothetical protein AWB81_01856 [Caballeronia arationis]|uniref:hypothetical protein n=1 Tax=Caballeronia arationis TaxID=1777142 RepID=UPI00074B7935|nr:hypothetical protein [Caballeronia arationis]SAK59514.1 hypothetical protein AWB81_01856 [Caballeronia arationis]